MPEHVRHWDQKISIYSALSVSVGFLLALIHTCDKIVRAAITPTITSVGKIMDMSSGAWKAIWYTHSPFTHIPNGIATTEVMRIMMMNPLPMDSVSD